MYDAPDASSSKWQQRYDALERQFPHLRNALPEKAEAVNGRAGVEKASQVAAWQ